MSRRTTVSRRTAVLFALAVLTPVAATTAANAGEAPPAVTVDTSRACPSNDLTVTIDNPTPATYQVTIEIGPVTPTELPPDEVVQEEIEPGETFAVTFEGVGTVRLAVLGDGDFPDVVHDPWFACPEPFEVTLSTPMDTPVEFDDPCGTSGDIDTPHGSIELLPTDGPNRLRYTPDPGFVGLDEFGWDCASSVERRVLAAITVTPVQAPPAAEPVPEVPTFTG